MHAPLNEIYLEALRRCDPAAIVATRLARERSDAPPRPVVALGKSARRVFEGLAGAGWRGRGLAIVPLGYEGTTPLPEGVALAIGSHPGIDESSFAAGETLLAFVAALDRSALVLVSGGASACAEVPLAPHVDRGELAAANDLLIRAGLPIESINVVRRHLSAIKGGRLAAMLPSESEAWIFSDVPVGRPDLVGSGPTFGDPSTCADAAAILGRLDDDLARSLARRLRSGSVPETPKHSEVRHEVLADNATLVGAASIAASDRGLQPSVVEEALEGDVSDAARRLADVAARLRPGEIALAGGEPTVVVRGSGRGGRCSELVLHLLLEADARKLARFEALVGSSDGRDGNSGAAAYRIAWTGSLPAGRAEILDALGRSDAHDLATRAGEPIIMPPTGNNLRDIMMMARA
ncbi:MAG TPA: DUF4147 domain-containing protein [Thermoanaerobaculia bacterium]|nr:DUF4147 domain-containing protein [Thermoanaerobaculia bacterium]